MSDTESLDYLQAGFDPSSLTVPRLRSILVTYGIPYPASSKKPQLIQLFEEHVTPQSKKILNARSRARRTSKGITNADRVDESPIPDEEMMPPPPSSTKTRGSSRKASTRTRVDDSESEIPARSPTKRTPRASSRQTRASDIDGTEDDAARRSASVRRSRKSEAPVSTAPVIKDEPVQHTPLQSKPSDASAFSYDNPFQSGSSPLAASQTPIGERRRKSAGTESSVRRKSTSRRRTDGTTKSESTTYELPVSKLNGLVDVDDNGVEAGEDFTPEEQLELVRDRSAKGVNAISRRPKKKSSNGFNKTGPIMVLLALLGGYAAWYRQEKIAVGYCGVGREAHPIVSSKVDLPEWAVLLAEPQCEPCPQHAYCFSNFEAACEQDFVLKPHPMAAGGLVPLPPTCEPDGDKVRRVKAVADRAVETLRERRAQFECGTLTDEAGTPAPTVEIDADKLKKDVSDKRRKGMGDAEFEELWAGAIGEMKGRDEIETSIDLDTQKLTLKSNSLARIPLSCALRRSFRLAVARHRFQIGLVVLSLLVALYGRWKYSSYKTTAARVPVLVNMTLDKLSNQAALHVQDRESYPEAWISIGQLRDDVLRTEHSVKKREALWQRVRKIVEMNANVRASQRESRNGEIARVWEWIGAVAAIEEGANRRKSGRVSFGAYENGSPVSGSDDGPEIVRSRWKESRPMF